MIRNYSQKEYEAKAEALRGLDFLYVLQHEVEVERPVYEFEQVEKTIYVEKFDEEGNPITHKEVLEQPIYDEEGNITGYEDPIEIDVPDTEAQTIMVKGDPIMEEVEEVDPETGETIIVKRQKFHMETFKEMQEDLMVDERFKFTLIDNGNTTDGTENENYAEEKQEFINTLKMTKRVFALMLEQVGISYANIKEIIAQDERADMEWSLCVELQRGNALLDPALEAVGVTPEMLNAMFLVANGLMELEQLQAMAK